MSPEDQIREATLPEVEVAGEDHLNHAPDAEHALSKAVSEGVAEGLPGAADEGNPGHHEVAKMVADIYAKSGTEPNADPTTDTVASDKTPVGVQVAASTVRPEHQLSTGGHDLVTEARNAVGDLAEIGQHVAQVLGFGGKR